MINHNFIYTKAHLSEAAFTLESRVSAEVCVQEPSCVGEGAGFASSSLCTRCFMSLIHVLLSELQPCPGSNTSFPPLFQPPRSRGIINQVGGEVGNSVSLVVPKDTSVQTLPLCHAWD